ncbi:MAG TPA: hypothetical protein VMU29_11750 [Smithella sp.]|nr:hypothetical protein [Smithella sp.]
MQKNKNNYFLKRFLSIKLWGSVAVAAVLFGMTAAGGANARWDATWQQGACIKENLTDSANQLEVQQALCGGQIPAPGALESYPVLARPVLVPVHPVPVRPVPVPVPVRPVPVRPVPMIRR